MDRLAKLNREELIARMRAGRLEWSAGQPGAARPTEFASEKGSEDNYVQFERLRD